MTGAARRYAFQAGCVTYDEARPDLLVDGAYRTIEAKPLALLRALLHAGGDVVSKRALMTAAWGNADHISEASLTTAMSKLRTALGPAGRDIVQLVHGTGYRIGVPVGVVPVADTSRPALAFAPGDAVPGRPQWRLRAALGGAAARDVWRAEHSKTGEARIFKFADTEARLETLKREATLSRLLHDTLGPREDLLRIAEWRFDERPYFIESPFGGLDLIAWAASQGGLATQPLEARCGMIAQVAATVAAAHGAGVLHGDIKPANILVAPSSAGLVKLRLVDFGAGGLSDAARLQAMTATLLAGAGSTEEQRSGTWNYLSPERLTGGGPTTGADIYALGVLLYQMVVADFERPLAVGWEADVADPLLRQDIALAAAGDLARRLPTAAALAERLTTLDERRAAARRDEAEAERAGALIRQVERDRARRPWIAGAVASLAAGLTLATVAEIRTVHERDEARRAAFVAQAVNGFLTQDLLGRGNPARSGKANESLMEAASAAEPGIDHRLAHEPMVAGSIYLALAQAFESRSDPDAARHAYDQAVAAFDRAGQAGEADAAIARLQAAPMEVVSGQPGSMPRARALIAAATARLATLGSRRPEADVWLAAANATLEMLGGDVRLAQADFHTAADRADAMPLVFDEATRLKLRQREAFTYLRLGRWDAASGLLRGLLDRQMALHGPHHPDTLIVELNLAQVQIAQGRQDAALTALQTMLPDFVAVFGADHRLTLQLLSTRAVALQALGRAGEAARDDATIYAAALARQGAQSFLALGALTDSAAALCRDGQIDAGLAAARRAQAGAGTGFGATSALAHAASVNLAFCLTRAGQYAAAAPLLDRVDSQAISELEIDPAYPAEVAVLRAQIALGLGNSHAARELLRTVGHVLDGGADPYMRDWAARLAAQLATTPP